MKNPPLITVTIATYNSARILPVCLQGIRQQNYPKQKIETIVADNHSQDDTVKIAQSFGAKVIQVDGKPNQACRQRNIGGQKARGKYIIFLDHDMEMSPNLIKNFVQHHRQHPEIDAWYIPEKIKASTPLLSTIRTYERSFYNGTIIDAVRIIRKSTFLKTPDQYDPRLTRGPADWDMDIQLKLIGAKFSAITEPLYHHEELLSFKNYILKKGYYLEGIEIYKNKWRQRSPTIYKEIVKKQFDPFYRFIYIFFVKGNWKKTIAHPTLFVSVLLIKLLMATIYLKAKLIKGIT